MIDEWSTPVNEPTDPISTHTTEIQDNESLSEEELDIPEKEEENPVSAAAITPATTTISSSGSRLLNQEEPVVLPATTTSSSISTLEVKFGSLNVEEEQVVEET